MPHTRDDQSHSSGEPAAVGELDSLTGATELLSRNQHFAAAGIHKDAPVFPKLRLVVISCLDPRTDPAHFLGLELSDAVVLRNVGARVTPGVINDLAFISQMAEFVKPNGPLFEIAVIHHTQCGAGALADASFRQAYANRIGVHEETLRDNAVVEPAQSVRIDIAKLRAAPSISKRVTVSGYVYDVVTGRLQPVAPSGPER